MTNRRIAVLSALGLVAAGLASLTVAMFWLFAAPASSRQADAPPGAAPATATTLQPSVGPGPQIGSAAPRTGAASAGSGARSVQKGYSSTGDGSRSVQPASESVAGWAAGVSARTGIPARAVQAYGYAELELRSEAPGCHLAWNTLAGIGMVESDHGRYGGATLAADGTETKAVVGLALDGSAGRRDLPATDQGRLTGDRVHDHAVGPMQLLPETWYRYADPGTDPQNIDAAALAAGRYLCADGRDLATAAGWWAAVFAYNNSSSYGDLVFHYADTYASDTR